MCSISICNFRSCLQLRHCCVFFVIRTLGLDEVDPVIFLLLTFDHLRKIAQKCSSVRRVYIVLKDDIDEEQTWKWAKKTSSSSQIINNILFWFVRLFLLLWTLNVNNEEILLKIFAWTRYYFYLLRCIPTFTLASVSSQSFNFRPCAIID